MKKTVIELFAGVGGFRVGLNDIHGFDESGKAIENNDWNFVSVFILFFGKRKRFERREVKDMTFDVDE